MRARLIQIAISHVDEELLGSKVVTITKGLGLTERSMGLVGDFSFLSRL